MSKIASAFRDTSERSALYPLRRFLASDVFSLMLVALAFVFICFNWIIPGAFAMGIVASLILILSDDIVSIFLPVMLIAVQMIVEQTLRNDIVHLGPFV